MLFIRDNTRSFKILLDGSEIKLDRMIEWSIPQSSNGFRVLASLLTQGASKKLYFLTPEDQVLLELLNNVDPELLLENKEIMRKFEAMYRFFRSLVR